MMKIFILLLTIVFSIAASADCSVDPNCVIQAGMGSGTTAPGPGCSNCAIFEKKKIRLPQAGPSAFEDSTNAGSESESGSAGQRK